MPATIKLDDLLQGNLARHIARRDGSDVRLESLVEVGHVRLVVLAVVQLHDLGRDVRLEGIVGVRQRREGVLGEAHLGEVEGVARHHGGMERRLEGEVLPQGAEVDHFEF
jgi:hypothetical protein